MRAPLRLGRKRGPLQQTSRIRLTSSLLLAAVGLAACSSKSAGGTETSSPTGTGAHETSVAVVPHTAVSFRQVTLAVPPGGRGAPFNVARALTIPSDWTAEVWARVPDARFAVWSPQGTLLVSSAESGQVLELTDRGKGAAARVRVLASGLSGPQGLAFDTLEGTPVLYVAETNRIDRYIWKGNGTLGARTVVVGGLPDTNPSGDDVHRAKSILVAPDHTIYVAVGSSSNASTPEPGESPPRATILSYRPDGTHMQVFASGVRNGEGLSFAPDGSLWTAVNQRDEIPYPFHRSYGDQPEAFGKVIGTYVNEHPPDEIARLTAGRNLGWPFCDPDPDVTPGDPATTFQYAKMPFVDDAQTNAGGTVLNCAKLAPIERGIPAHSAPLGFHFLQGTKIAAPWSAGAVLGSHGSWDRTPPRAPSVLWLPWESNMRTLGPPITLIGGFQEPSGNRWGRPVDAVVGPDGALYVTDDTAGAVYRFPPRG